MDSFKELLSVKYIQDTKYYRDKLGGHRVFVAPRERFKEYPLSKKIKLNKNFDPPTIPLFECLKKRRSIRSYQKKDISLDDLAKLLWATQGITEIVGDYYLRTAPSAGALYPIETYLIVNYSSEINEGIYHFNVLEFSLEEIKVGNFSEELVSACLGQSFLKKCPVVFIWTSVTRRCASKYLHRAARYIMMDVGHICQNLCLGAVALDLGVCPVAAFFDDELNELLEVDGTEETAIYLASVGYPK